MLLYDYPFRYATETDRRCVWSKGYPINGYDPRFWRVDVYGNLMYFPDHGDTSSSYGWEIDHIIPKSKGGSDLLGNLQPLQWQNNRRKGDQYP